MLRDAAYALKHGVLTHPKPRIVRKSEQVQTLPGAFDGAVFQQNACQTELVWIEGMDTDYRADEVIRDVVQIANAWLVKLS